MVHVPGTFHDSPDVTTFFEKTADQFLKFYFQTDHQLLGNQSFYLMVSFTEQFSAALH